jgi:hypothetical protein
LNCGKKKKKKQRQREVLFAQERQRQGFGIVQQPCFHFTLVPYFYHILSRQYPIPLKSPLQMIYALWVLFAIMAHRTTGFVIASISNETQAFSLDTSVLEGDILSTRPFASVLAAGDAGIGKSTGLNALALHLDTAGSNLSVLSAHCCYP